MPRRTNSVVTRDFVLHNWMLFSWKTATFQGKVEELVRKFIARCARLTFIDRPNAYSRARYRDGRAVQALDVHLRDVRTSDVHDHLKWQSETASDSSNTLKHEKRQEKN